MKANELRLGGIIHFHTAEGDIVPIETTWQQIEWACNGDGFFNMVHSPIPLTDEWLVRFGFEKDFADQLKTM